MSGEMSAPGRTVLVTGATDGLGRALALELARRGWTVLAHGRDAQRGAALVAELEKAGARAARFYKADFASLAEVADMARRVLHEEPALHVLINNAGIGMLRDRAVSQDGHELVFQVNYLAGYLLSQALTPLLARTGEARIINVASAAQYPINFDDLMLDARWNGVIAYGRSKLAQILLTVTMSEELGRHGIAVNAVHPASLMPTKITAQLSTLEPRGFIGKLIMKRLKPRSTLAEGVANVLRLINEPTLASVTGRYFRGAREKKANKQAYDASARRALQAVSSRLCQDALARVC
jgi:NAD(P)-dependent dehydrogenase (short-subunit alcohol dehydrogenase family)